MATKLTTIGDQLAVILDRSSLDALGITSETELEVLIDDQGFRIRPIIADHRERVRVSSRKMMEIYDETFRTLAE